MLVIFGGRYRLLQIEAPQLDAVFVRADLAPLFPFAAHSADEIWRRFVFCEPYYLLDKHFHASYHCDVRLFADDTLSWDWRLKLARRCALLDLDLFRGAHGNSYSIDLRPEYA